LLTWKPSCLDDTVLRASFGDGLPDKVLYPGAYTTGTTVQGVGYGQYGGTLVIAFQGLPASTIVFYEGLYTYEYTDESLPGALSPDVVQTDFLPADLFTKDEFYRSLAREPEPKEKKGGILDSIMDLCGGPIGDWVLEGVTSLFAGVFSIEPVFHKGKLQSRGRGLIDTIEVKSRGGFYWAFLPFGRVCMTKEETRSFMMEQAGIAYRKEQQEKKEDGVSLSTSKGHRHHRLRDVSCEKKKKIDVEVEVEVEVPLSDDDNIPQTPDEPVGPVCPVVSTTVTPGRGAISDRLKGVQVRLPPIMSVR